MNTEEPKGKDMTDYSKGRWGINFPGNYEKPKLMRFLTFDEGHKSPVVMRIERCGSLLSFDENGWSDSYHLVPLPEEAPHGWVIVNDDGTFWLSWFDGARWQSDHRSMATRFHRREDAEAVMPPAEGWYVVPYEPEDE